MKGEEIMPLEIIRNDITKMKVDAIVNAANTELRMGGGVCGAIFQAAGAVELQEACNKIGECPTGQAVITDGFKLPAKYIIHTPGPIWQGGSKKGSSTAQSSLRELLDISTNHQCESIAFPLISTGIYGYPKEEALQIAVSTISSFLLHHDILVYLVVFDKNSFCLSQKLVHSIHEYIDEHYVEEAEKTFQRDRREEYEEIKLFQEAEKSSGKYG